MTYLFKDSMEGRSAKLVRVLPRFVVELFSRAMKTDTHQVLKYARDCERQGTP